VIESTHVGPEGGQMLVDRTVEIVKKMWATEWVFPLERTEGWTRSTFWTGGNGENRASVV